MNISINTPHWVQPIQSDNWPTHLVESTELGYSLPIKQGWYAVPEVQQTPFEIEHIYQGQFKGEWLLVNFMGDVDPAHNLCNWVDHFIPTAGFPSLFIKEIEYPQPELIEWNYEGKSNDLATKLHVDEVHLYQGLANLPGPSSELIRLYILVARREQKAWKITLSIQSACFPGMAEELVNINDHTRAGATFGYLELPSNAR